MSRLSQLQRLFLRAAVLPPPAAAEAWQSWTQTGDLQHMDAESNGMVCVLYKNLETAGIRSQWGDVMKGNYRYHWTQNQILLRDVGESLDVLREAGIPAYLGRELAVLAAYAQDPGLRSLVLPSLRVGDLNRASEALGKAGWKAESTGYLHRDFILHGERRLAVQSTVYPGCSIAGISRDLVSRSVRVEIAGASGFRLDPADEFLALSLDAYASPSGRMRMLADAYLLYPFCNAQTLIDEARSSRHVRPLQRLLRELQIELDVPTSDLLLRLRPTPFEAIEAVCLATPALSRLRSCFDELRAQRLHGAATFFGFANAIMTRIKRRLR